MDNLQMNQTDELCSEGLCSLNLTIVDQEYLEAKVDKALDDAVADLSKKQQINIMKTDEVEIQQEIKKLIQRKEYLELRVKNMKRKVSNPRRTIVVEKQIQETEKRIESQKKLREQLSNKLSTCESGLPEVFFRDDIENEEEKQKSDMIKTGEMTPFGTITNSSVGKKAPIFSRIVKSPMTDFEKYQSDEMDRQKSRRINKSKMFRAQAGGIMKLDVSIASSSKQGKEEYSDSDVINRINESMDSTVCDKPTDDSDYAPSSGGGESDGDSGKDSKEYKNSKRIDYGPRKLKDDGNLADFTKRIKKFRKQRLQNVQSGICQLNEGFHQFSNGFKIPISIWEALYKFQRTGIQWLLELHGQQCGGILGDEMGLGKTIQVVAFLVGLSVSRLPTSLGNRPGLGPVLIICPATVLQQWLREFHKWWPEFRVAILHGSGSFTGKRPALIHNINSCSGILVTSYTGARAQLKTLLQYQWHYVILDEGQHIRNPSAQITVAVKRIETPHRIILSGSPIQNSLKELWSLFDFIFPGKLGTLPVFMEEFAVPITQGGYSNASKLEVQTAYRCATVLKDTISPFLLRRMKSDVRRHLSLPDKSEQVLFCGLSDEQRAEYKAYLESKELGMIFRGQLMAFVGLITLRKICNHPDIFNGGPRDPTSQLQPEAKYGYWKRSGKMVVLKAILKLWSKQGHRGLLFTQSRQMLIILSKFLQDEHYTYLKMDGSTTVGSRQLLIDKFNGDSSIFLFLLTTRVGGLGVNLTGADRVIIYDPDWNPSTDVQARERAWRIGQLRHVTIYRLLTAGTIEEKIYHRQIFKQFITNRVLKDPKQQRFFKTSVLNDLFTLTESDNVTETSTLFAGTGAQIRPKKRKRPNDMGDLAEMDRRNPEEKSLQPQDVKNDPNETERKMRELAKLISKKIGGQNERKKRKKSHNKKVDGSRINNLVKKRAFKNSGTGCMVNTGQDEYVLKKLFNNSSVHSAYRHDAIVNGHNQDHLLLEAEANKVAKNALRKLKASRELYSRPHPADRKKSRKFGAKTNFNIEVTESNCGVHHSKEQNENVNDNTGVLSSVQLLSKIRQRRTDEVSSSEQNFNDVVEDHEQLDENDELLSDISDFVAFQTMYNGRASTQEILDKFKERLPPEKSLIFRTLLCKVCDFEKDFTGQGFWHLKTDMR